MDKHKIVTYHHPNPEIQSFLTVTEISTYRVEHFKRPFNQESKDVIKTLSIIGAGIVREILDIPGVKELHMKPKEILVKKEASYSWEGLEDKVVKILHHAFRRKEIRVVNTKKNKI